MKNVLFSTVVAIALFGSFANASRSLASWNYAKAKLHKSGLSPSFILALQHVYRPSDFNSVMALNCLLFLKKPVKSVQKVSKKGRHEVALFMRYHRRVLALAERRYGVPPAIISSVLWTESRYGHNSGLHNVASVFVDLVQADRLVVIRHLLRMASPEFTGKLNREKRSAIIAQAHRKAAWALIQLKALQRIFRRNRKLCIHLKGSFAGAFGMPQFEPTSYVEYATSWRSRQSPDLLKADDAIFSVANFLKINGLRLGRPATYKRALFHYNHSTDYVKAVLALSSSS